MLRGQVLFTKTSFSNEEYKRFVLRKLRQNKVFLTKFILCLALSAELILSLIDGILHKFF